jgi:Mg2+/Co2+ transporter CorC
MEQMCPDAKSYFRIISMDVLKAENMQDDELANTFRDCENQQLLNGEE